MPSAQSSETSPEVASTSAERRPREQAPASERATSRFVIKTDARHDSCVCELLFAARAVCPSPRAQYYSRTRRATRGPQTARRELRVRMEGAGASSSAGGSSSATTSSVTRQFPGSIGAIVYLTQGGQHSSYGQSTMQQLHKSVGLLYKHYNAKQRDDVVFLHTGDVDDKQQESVLRLCGAEARFVLLAKRHFQLPPGVDPKSKQWLFPNKFSPGYRHMIRFFTLGIWEVAASLGYQYVMRLDDDAYILSPITYNVFAFMASRRLEYAFRLTSWEHGEPAQRGELHKFVRDYALKGGIQPRWGLSHSCPDGQLESFTPDNCGQFYTIYNNFFVANVSFWRRPDVQAFVQHVDASKTIYYKRWGDAVWHSVALQLFLPRDRVHMFEDFSYEHTSRKIYYYRGKPTACFQWGGLALGSGTHSREELGRARALSRIAMCSRARGDVNRCLVTRRSSSRLLGIFAGTVTPEPPEVLHSYCFRLRAEKEPQPNAICIERYNKSGAPRPYVCANRRKALNTSIYALFGVGSSETTFRNQPQWVDGQLNRAVRDWKHGTAKVGAARAAAPPPPASRDA